MNPLNFAQGAPINMAQQLLIFFGVPETKVFFGHKLGRNPSTTKRGPGRKHQQRHIKN